MLPITPSGIIYIFVTYIFIMLVFLGSAIGLHEIGHIIYARYHHLDYRILFQKGNITIFADWEKLGNRKVYGNVIGIIFGLPPIIVGGWMYYSPVFLMLYLLACYDDFSDIVVEISGYKKVF